MAPDAYNFGDIQVHSALIESERLAMLTSCEEFADESLSPNHIIFRQPVAQFDHSRTRPLIFLLRSGKEYFTHIAVGHRGYSGGTGLSQIVLSYAEATKLPIPVKRLVARLDNRFANLAAAPLKNGGLLTLKTSHAVLRELIAMHPSTQRVVERALKYRPLTLSDLSEGDQFYFQQQQDAVLMSFEFAGLDRKELIETEFAENKQPKSYLEGLKSAKLREGAMLTNDASRIPGFTQIKQWVQNAKSFTDGKTLLTIHLVHEQPLENLIGTDLIYYNESFKSFVMVQYKAMDKERSDHLFRLPDEDLDREIENMLMFGAGLEEIQESQTDLPHGFRLNSDPFFLKFCPRIVPEPDSIDLIPGMYMPLNYWLRLEASTALHGPKGGKALRFENAGRYLTNTDFICLVRNAWMGTHMDQSSMLEKLIRRTLESGKAITLAELRTPESSRPSH